MFAPGQENGARLLSDELLLIGIGVRQVRGHESLAHRILLGEAEESPADAVISVQPLGTTIWVKDRSTGTFHVQQSVLVRSESGESADSQALRSVELVRGQLLEGKTRGESDSAFADQGIGVKSEGTAASRLTFTVGPSSQSGSYTTVSWGLAADAALWFGRVGLGSWLMLAPTRSSFRPSPKKISVTQFSAGVQVRGQIFASPTEFFVLQVVGRSGWRRMTFYEEKGMEDERFRGASGSLLLGGGAAFSFTLTPRIRLGVGLGADIGVPLFSPEQSADSVNPADEVPKEVSESQGPDLLLWTSGAVTFQF